ncbi:MAG: recombination protein NinB [Sulfitobacter sp.]
MAAVVRLINSETRARAKHWLNIAEPGVIVTFRKPTRTNEQNAKMWACLNDISTQKELHGKKRDKDVWKAVMMRELGHEVSFETDLQGDVFPMGYSTSKLTVGQMGDLITVIVKWGDEVGVVWSEEAKK